VTIHLLFESFPVLLQHVRDVIPLGRVLRMLPFLIFQLCTHLSTSNTFWCHLSKNILTSLVKKHIVESAVSEHIVTSPVNKHNLALPINEQILTSPVITVSDITRQRTRYTIANNILRSLAITLRGVTW